MECSVSPYQLDLPSKAALERELEKIEAEIDQFGLEAGELGKRNPGICQPIGIQSN